MAHGGPKLDETAMVLSKFSGQVSDSQTALNEQFVRVQTELRKFDKLEDISERGDIDPVINQLHTAMKHCKDYIEFLESAHKQLMQSSYNKLYKEQGVQKREAPGRKCDSGVYSVGSQVLSTTIDPRTLSSSNMLVTQASDDIEEPSSTGTEHDERAELPTGGETEA